MTTATAVDWSKAQQTKRAANALVNYANDMRRHADNPKHTKPPSMPYLRPVVRLSQAVFEQYHTRTWSELEAAAGRREKGVEQWFIYGIDIAPQGFAYFRGPEKGYDSRHAHAQDLAFLFSQGW